MIQPEKFSAGMTRQLERFHEALASGMPRRGWKMAINVPEILAHLSLPHSGLGWIDGSRVFESGAVYAPEGEAPESARLLVEPEIAIRLSRSLPPEPTRDFARESIESIAPALEIVNLTNPASELGDVIASCMFHEATILGAPAPLSALDGLDLGGQWPLLRSQENQAEAPRADLVPVDLAELVAFAAAYLAAFGESLEAGDLILSGSFTAKALPVAAGEEAIASFGTLGEVSFTRAG